MKKALLATTAVVLSAGVAAAEVKLSGDARFGLQYSKAGFANGKTSAVEKRLRFNIDAVTTTDAGVTLGGRIRLTSNEGQIGGVGNTPVTAANGGTSASGARVYAQYNGFTVAVGNILGAVETAPNFSRHAIRYTLTTLDYTPLAFDAFDSSNNGAEGIEVIYKQGPLGFHLSHSSSSVAKLGPVGATRRTAAHVSYSFSGWTVAGIVQDSSNNLEDFYGITAGGKVGDFGVTFEAYDLHNANAKFARLQGEYAFGPTSVSGYVSKYSGRKTTFGLGASYDLGGNARLVGGVSRVGLVGTSTTVADAGVTFSF